jgi:hypothetical protein
VRRVPDDAVVFPASDREGLNNMLRSGTVWLGMLGELREAVKADDHERARELAQRPLTYPQPYPRG